MKKESGNMITTLINQFKTGWHPMRWVALGIGIVLGLNWMLNTAPISGLLSIFFLFQAITNSGCIVGTCAPVYMTDENDKRTTHYEEIK